MSSTLTPPTATLLDQILAYRNESVIRRYALEHAVSLAEAERLFVEMLKFLYLSGTTGERLGVYPIY